MDIVKLLSRSTKHTNRSSTQPAKSNNFPSAGKNANPQLFHDAVCDIRGKKRKRGDVELAEPEEKLEDALDYFAPKGAVKPTNSEPSVQAPITASPQSVELLAEAECRQILRSHRIKISLLPSKPSKVSKPKKVKRPKPTTKKQEIRQLYPQPLESFADLQKYGISRRLGQNLALEGYKIPTEVQMGSLPLLLQPEMAFTEAQEPDLGNISEVDLLAVAPTGSGKTLAFLIPAINGIIQRRRESDDKKLHHLEAVVVAPTKELASQIVNEGKKLSLGTGVKVVLMRKGMNVASAGDGQEEEYGSQESSEQDSDNDDHETKQRPPVKADILVTTPLNLVHALLSNTLPTVRNLILDEADVLLDPLFRSQTLHIWNACTNPRLRAALWSATIGSGIEDFALTTILSRRSSLNMPSSTPIIRLVVGLKDSAIPNITHGLTYATTEAGKLLALRQLLHPTASTIDGPALRPPFLVFTSTIPRAQALYSELLYDIPLSAGGSSRIAVLHSSLSSTARGGVMTRFRNGEIWVLITTDLLARGVDFRGVNGVVNYDCPGTAAGYVHRVGRTGRAGREGGMAVTFYTKEDVEMGVVRGVVGVVAEAERQAGKGGGEKKWLLDLLPRVGKGERERVRRKWVKEGRKVMEGRGKDGKGKGGRISTKSGYVRRLEGNRRGAIEASKRRKEVMETNNGEESEWSGFGSD